MPVVALVKLGSTDEAVSAAAQMLESGGVEAITAEGFEQELTALPLLYLLVFIDNQYDMAHSFLEIYHLRESHRLIVRFVLLTKTPS